MADDYSDIIDETAAGPKSVETDGLKVEAQPLPDLIAADQRKAANRAAAKRHRGIRFTQIVPPGAD